MRNFVHASSHYLDTRKEKEIRETSNLLIFYGGPTETRTPVFGVRGQDFTHIFPQSDLLHSNTH